jgi:anaerobic selenocysteine-containing dehydrogenase
MSAADGIHYRACNLCEAICGIAVTVRDGRVSDLRGDLADAFSRGHICPKGSALIDLREDPDRLREPRRRVGSRWETIGWDEAFDDVAARLTSVIGEHGDDALAIYLGNPNVHNSGTLLSFAGMLRAFRTRNRFSATSVDQLPHHRAAVEMFGHPMLVPIPDVDRTDFLLVLGANPLVSNGSIMTAPGMRDRIASIRARGGSVVVVDPRRTETAAVADAHHFIRPGTDAFFLLAMLHVVFASGAATLGDIADFTDGFDEIRELVRDFAPEVVAAITGMPAAAIRELAAAFIAAPRAAAYGRIGLSTQTFGGLCQWLVIVLNAVTGNLDRAGGMMWTHPAFDLVGRAQRGATYADRWFSRVRGLGEFDGEFPVATLADEMLVPGPGQVRALITSAGNPVLTTPNGARLDAALRELDFYVAIDPYLNETTRHAHIILPPAIGLEVPHYDVIFHHFAVRNTARYSEPVFALEPHQRYDYEIFGALRERLTGKAGDLPEERLERGFADGPYATTLADLRAHPHGVDYGPLRPAMPDRLLTANSRIALAPQIYVNDLARLRAALDEPIPTLVAIGRRQLRSNNSWMHNAPRLMRGADRCTALMHTDDAHARGIADGDDVEIHSRVGSITIPVQISDEVMPGVISLPHGFGHDGVGTQLSEASAHAGVSLNDLTDHERLDDLTGNAAFSGLPVDVRALVR